MLEIWAGVKRKGGGVASLMWAVELLGEEPPRDTCPGLKVQQGYLREELSSTPHPGKEIERLRVRPIEIRRKGLVNSQGEERSSLDLFWGTKME